MEPSSHHHGWQGVLVGFVGKVPMVGLTHTVTLFSLSHTHTHRLSTVGLYHREEAPTLLALSLCVGDSRED